jgi:hypothetical protein
VQIWFIFESFAKFSRFGKFHENKLDQLLVLIRSDQKVILNGHHLKSESNGGH